MTQVIKKAYFLCSPSLGILDNWLPVIKQIKNERPDLEIVCLIPKAGTVEQVSEKDAVSVVADKEFESFVFKTHGGLWIESSSFFQAKRINTCGECKRFILRIITKVKKYPLLKLFSDVGSAILKILDRVTYSNAEFQLSEIPREKNVLFYDVCEESKEYNKELIGQFSDSRKFSICHGININTDPIVKRHSGNRKLHEITAYLFSEEEKSITWIVLLFRNQV